MGQALFDCEDKARTAKELWRNLWLFEPPCQPMTVSAGRCRTRRSMRHRRRRAARRPSPTGYPQTQITDPARFIARFATSTYFCAPNASMKRITPAGSTAWIAPTIPCGPSRNHLKGSRFESSAAELLRRGSVSGTCRTRAEKCRRWPRICSAWASGPWLSRGSSMWANWTRWRD